MMFGSFFGSSLLDLAVFVFRPPALAVRVPPQKSSAVRSRVWPVGCDGSFGLSNRFYVFITYFPR